MAEIPETIEMIAKEITIASLEVVSEKIPATAENVGNVSGKLYKLILKHVREAIIDKKYD
jgi:hypothetical protein